MLLLACHTAHEPVARALGLARYGNIISRLSLKIARVVPVNGHIFDELEGVHVLLVVLWQVCRHLYGAVHRAIEGQLVGDCRIYVRMVVGIYLLDVHLENTWSIVHRASLEAGEWQYGDVHGLASAESLVLCATCRLVADKVRIRAAQSGGAHSLVTVHHDVVLGGLFHGVQVVVVHPLAVVVLALGQHVAHVSALHRVVTVLVHKRVSGLHVALVVAR